MASLQNDYLKENFQLFYKRLKNKCNYYDKGDFLMAIDIAVQLRVLLHDTTDKNGKKISTSLLEHLNKKNIDFVDSSCERGFNNYNLESNISGHTFVLNTNYYHGLVRKSVSNNAIKEELQTIYEPLGIQHIYQYISFLDWWENNDISVFYVDSVEYTLKRKDLIIILSNKDGGAHYDKNLYIDDKFVYYKRQDILGLNINGITTQTQNIPLYPSVRQIAGEVLLTLEKNLNEYIT